MKIATLLLILLSIAEFSYSQYSDTAEDSHETHEAWSPHHKLSLVMANSLITSYIGDNSNSILLVPTFGLNYDFIFHSRWGVGLHSDIIVQQFKIEEHDSHDELIRENPVAVCVVGIYKPLAELSLLVGYGVEIEKHENLQLARFGAEYGIHLPKNWELGFMLEYDIKFKTYGTLMFGIGFSKILSNE